LGGFLDDGNVYCSNSGGYFLIKGLGETYAQVSTNVFIGVLALSILWGIGNLLWGISISKIGMTLGLSLLIGITTLVGSILPFLMGSFDKLSTPGGMVISLGIFVIMLRIIANVKAGLLRESNNERNEDADGKNMRVGIIMCVVGVSWLQVLTFLTILPIT